MGEGNMAIHRQALSESSARQCVPDDGGSYRTDGVCSALMHRSCLDGPDVLSPPQGGGHTDPSLRLQKAQRKNPH